MASSQDRDSSPHPIEPKLEDVGPRPIDPKVEDVGPQPIDSKQKDIELVPLDSKQNNIEAQPIDPKLEHIVQELDRRGSGLELACQELTRLTSATVKAATEHAFENLRDTSTFIDRLHSDLSAAKDRLDAE